MNRKNPSPQKDQKSAGPVKMEHLLLALVVIGVAYFFMRGRNQATMQAEAPPVNSQSKGTQEVQVLATNQPPVDMRKYQDELNTKRAQYAQIRALGIKTLELKPSGDTVSVPLVFAPRKVWCQGGDLDTMKYASKNDDNKEFVITLEGIGAGGKNPYVRTSLKELYKGLNYTFTIPRPKSTTSYGLYICSDSKNDNSCQRKGMESHAQLSEQLAQSPEKAKAQDRIFFFQNLVIDGKKVEAYRSDDFSNEFQKSIGSHLNKRGLSATEVAAAWKANATLKSTPTDIREGKIVLSLPYNDPRCTQVLSGKGK